jgi:hypothetical protein
MVCLIAQVCLSLAPAGADICTQAVADMLTPPEVVKSVCDCCGEPEEVADESAPTSGLPDQDCPPGCRCCITVPVMDRPSVPPAPPENDCLCMFVPVLVAMLPPACELDAVACGLPPPRHPPPSFATELRSIRLVI